MSDKPQLTEAEVDVLVAHIRELRAENERLRSEQSLLGVLREIATDPSVPPHLRLKAAEAGVTYEQPKLSANISTVSTVSGIGDRLDAARRRLKEAEDRGLRVIEGDPAA